MLDSTEGEAERLAALHSLGILNTAPEEHFDAVCRVARRLFRVPTAFVSLVDRDTQWIKACVGPIGPDRTRENAFCDVAILSEEILVVPDATLDDRFHRNPFVTGSAHLRFYVGAPLVLRPGIQVGALCLIDTEPRAFAAEQIQDLKDLAKVVVAHLRAYETVIQRDRESAARRSSEEREADLERRELQLIEANARLLRAEHIAHVGHWQLDVRRNRRIWSNEVRNIFGIGPDEPVPGIDAANNGYHPSDRNRVRDALSASMDLQRDFELETRVLRPDGDVREVVVRGICEVDDEGATKGLFGVCIDVTKINETERRLREAEGKFRLLVESVSDYAIYMLDPNGVVTNWNVGAQRAKGYTAEEIVGRNFSCFYTPEDEALGRPQAALRSAADNGRYEAEGWRVRRDGSCFFCSVVITAMRDDRGVLVGFAKITRDITEKRKAEMEIKASEVRYRLLAENVTDVIVQADLDSTRRYVSPSSREVLGFEPEELIGRKAIELVDPSEAADYQKFFEEIRDGKSEKAISRRRYRRRDGTAVWIEGVHRLIRDELSGEPTGYIASLRDITARKAAEDQLRDKSLLLDRTLENMDQGLLMIDATGIVRVYNQRVLKLLDLPDAFLRSQPSLKDIFDYQESRDEFARSPQELRTLLRPGDTLEDHHVYERERPDGTMLEVRTVRLGDGGAVRTYTDITVRKEAERRIEYLAGHDDLTAMPNRRVFDERLRQELRGSVTREGACAVLCLDLDRFKAINDMFGHRSGDAVLKAVAERIGSVLRPKDLAARMGGDEFAILVTGLIHRRDAALQAGALIDAVCQPCEVSGVKVSVGLSVGIAFAPADTTDPEQLVKSADLALYRAKASGRNTYRFFDPAMDTANEERMHLEIDIGKALAEHQFVLHYQPCVSIENGSVVGVEALLRWQHPTRGLIPPGAFIPLAEESGLIVPLGAWVLREACQAATEWPDYVRIAVNVSVVQFRQDGLEDTIVSALASSGLAPCRLEIEITESVLLRDSEAVLIRLSRLRQLGIGIALDDFGTGYSSLSYLHKFQFDKIKIDRSFIQQIDNPSTSAIVRAIVGIGRHQGSAITGEGVETQQQFDRVAKLGCTEVQGYFFSKPVPLSELTELLLPPDRRRKRRRVAASA